MRRYLVFFVVSLALMLSSIGGSAASVAFPVMIADLNTSADHCRIRPQRVSARRNRGHGPGRQDHRHVRQRTAFIAFTALFSIGSVLCALAPNIYVLIGARVIQALGGGGFMPCAAGIVSETFPENRQRFIGLFSSIFPIGMILGPNLGGWMVQSFGWRSIFWFNVPLGVAVLVLSWIMVPHGQKQMKTTIDSVGAGLLFGALQRPDVCLHRVRQLAAAAGNCPGCHRGRTALRLRTLGEARQGADHRPRASKTDVRF